MELRERYRGCLLGLAAGDAVGTTVEFYPRGGFQPVTGMVGMGPFNLKPGEWTDDTSMALCLAASLIECKGFDPNDQMQRYWKWYQQGYMSSNGRCFDIGNTVSQALRRYQQSGGPLCGSTDPYTAGNGSIMRLAPVVLYYYPDLESVRYYAVESSKTTHAAQECLDACLLLADILHKALQGREKQAILLEMPDVQIISPKIAEIAAGSYMNKSEAEIQGSGYVVKSLEAAIWCFWSTENYRQAILTAANLGDDADTTAAICGQIAGAYYGEGGIPEDWLNQLAKREEIAKLAEDLIRSE